MTKTYVLKSRNGFALIWYFFSNLSAEGYIDNIKKKQIKGGYFLLMKKIKQRLITSVFAMTIVIACSFGVAFAADTSGSYKDTSFEKTYVNPIYEDEVTKQDIKEETSSGISLFSSSSDSVYRCSSIADAGKYLRTKAVARTENISIAVEYPAGAEVTSDKWFDMSQDIITEAMKHTGNPIEGDYIRWQYKGYSIKGSNTEYNGKHYALYKYTLSYMSSADQESKVTSAIATAKSKMNLSGSQYNKIKAIHKYICDNVAYDYAAAEDPTNEIAHTAYGAIINKKAVCQGYAVLLYRLALEEGIDARLVAGFSSAGGHAWNIVKIDGRYYYLDSTWDAGKSKYDYFLTGSSTFKSHGMYKMDEDITKNYKVNPISYIDKISLSTTNYTYSGGVKTPSVKVIDGNGNTISSSYYTVAYPSGRKSVGQYKVTVNFKNNYSGSKNVYFNINPKGTSISKLYRYKKAFTVKWNKQSQKMASSVITGYQIRYSTSSSMTGAAYKTISGYKNTSKKVGSLKAKKRYYVQVRTYKKVGSTYFYSGWSSKKYVTTK